MRFIFVFKRRWLTTNPTRPLSPTPPLFYLLEKRACVFIVSHRPRYSFGSVSRCSSVHRRPVSLMGERGAAILSSPPPPPLAHSHMHWLTAQITHTTVSAPLQHRHSDNGTLWLSYFCYKKKKKELQSQVTPQLQNRKPCIILTELWQSSASKTGNWQEKKALKKTKKTKPKQMFLNNKCGLEQYAKS